MMQHIHYGNWTIEWGGEEKQGFRFWICTDFYLPGCGAIEHISHSVGFFPSVKKGTIECERYIELIVEAQRASIFKIPAEMEAIKQMIERDCEESIVSEEEDDGIPF